VTGLIYVAIIALWAAVLIPMWLRRHDDDQARRIERHRVAMGTLARIADDPETAQSAAVRRRRVIIAATATLGALGSAAWIAGLLPGLVTAVLWLPLVAFLPAAVVTQRRASRAAAERALAERRQRRTMRDTVESMSRTIEEQEQPAPVQRPGSLAAPAVAWDDVFDQTA
jgi:membrane protein implicated in regulation of membrane protease activity